MLYLQLGNWVLIPLHLGRYWSRYVELEQYMMLCLWSDVLYSRWTETVGFIGAYTLHVLTDLVCLTYRLTVPRHAWETSIHTEHCHCTARPQHWRGFQRFQLKIMLFCKFKCTISPAGQGVRLSLRVGGQNALQSIRGCPLAVWPKGKVQLRSALKYFEIIWNNIKTLTF